MFSNGHLMVTSCLFLQYDPSTNPKKAGKVLAHSSEYQFFALFNFAKLATFDEGYNAESERSNS